jgi:acyl-CoA synthetase (AMP-forming)/AMP-acid ligase II
MDGMTHSRRARDSASPSSSESSPGLDSANIARHLPLVAAQQPDRPAIKVPRGRRAGQIDYLVLTFQELDAEVDAWVARLQAKGVRREDRVLVMVRQGLPLVAAAFALFKLGAVPVIIDPGMGQKSFLACVARSRPRVLLGIPLAQVMSYIHRDAFATVEVRVWVSGSTTARLGAGSQTSDLKSQMVGSAASDLAAILFTSGSTGAPKGVSYQHGMFEAQVRLIRDAYRIAPGEVDLPMLPIFALFNPALGMTTVVPELDPSRPAAVDPAKIIQAIQQEQVTNSFGSPTLWRKIFDYCLAHQVTLPSIRRVLCAGAPVPASLWADARRVLPNGELHSPYGATEALPIATVSAKEIPAPGDPGALLGWPLPTNRAKIIAIQDGPIVIRAAFRSLPPGRIGEIVVTGPSVTHEYDGQPSATTAAKFYDGAALWHRMGDAGYLDASGRLWFCGRLVERVETRTGTLHTEPVEQVFRPHPGVARCALVGLGLRGRQTPALVVQPVSPGLVATREKRHELARALQALGATSPHASAVLTFFFHPGLPVDVRHNAKIHRLDLARWAEGEEGIELSPPIPDEKRP